MVDGAAFERARASGKAVDDTRLRIFFVMALFSAGFLTLGLVAVRAALFSGLGNPGAAAGLSPNARADVVDRNGQILAMDLIHYGLYLDPREIWDPGRGGRCSAGPADAVARAPGPRPGRPTGGNI